MRPALYLMRAWGRGRVAALLAVALLAGATFGFVVLAGLGAVRAGTAWEDLRDDGRGEDLLLDVPTIDSAREVTDRASRLEGVSAAAPIAYSYLVPDGRQEDFFGGVILRLGSGATGVWNPRLLRGRAADPGKADEVVVNREFVSVSGLDLGARFDLVDPLGLIRQRVTITGIGVLPVDFTFGAAAPLAFPTTALTEAWSTELHELESELGPEVVGAAVAIVGDDGVDVDALVGRVHDGLPPTEVKFVNRASSSSALVVDTLKLQRDGYITLTVVAGLASVATIGLLFAGVARIRPDDVTALRATGLGQRDLRRAVQLPGLVVVLLGTCSALGITLLFEDLVPSGLAERVGSSRTVDVEPAVLAVAALLVAVVLGALVSAAALRPQQPRPAASARRRAPGLLGRPTIGLGLRSATGSLAPFGPRRALAALTTVAVGVIGISAVGVVVASRDQLLEHPLRVGKFMDVLLYTYADPTEARADRAALLGSNAVRAVSTIEIFTVEVDGQSAPAISIDPLARGLEPPIVEGRLPSAPNEIVTSVPFLRQTGRAVGDTVVVAGPAGRARAVITGTVVLPFASSVALGEQLAMSPEMRSRLGSELDGVSLAVDLRSPDAASHARGTNDRLEACGNEQILDLLGADRLAGPAGGEVNVCVPHGDQRSASLAELGQVPSALVGFLVVLGTAGLAFQLAGTVLGGRRQLAILRAIGFTRMQVTVTLVVHAAAVALVGCLVALPLGVALGRWGWRAPAETLGVAVRPEVSIAMLVALVIGTVVVAELMVLPLARRVLAAEPARALRPD